MAVSRLATLRLLAVLVALFILGNQLLAYHTAHHRHVFTWSERDAGIAITVVKAEKTSRASVHPTLSPRSAATAAAWPSGAAIIKEQAVGHGGTFIDPRFSTFIAGDGNDNGEGAETTPMSWEVRLSVVVILFVLCAFAIFLGYHLGERQT